MRLSQSRGPFHILDIYLENLSLAELKNLQNHYSRISVLSHHPQPALEHLFIRKKKTPLIDLHGTPDEIFKRFRDTVRNEIRRTYKLPSLEIRVCASSYTDAYEMYAAFEYAQNRIPISKNEFCQYTLAVAYLNGVCISGITFFQSNNIARIRSIFSKRLNSSELDQETYKIIGYASKRLMYEVCLYARDAGDHAFDLASINLNDPNKASIAAYKMGFGATIVDEYHYQWKSGTFRFMEKLTKIKAWVMLKFLSNAQHPTSLR